MESFTWNGMAWLVLEATLSEPSRRKLLLVGRPPEMLKVAPTNGDPAGVSCDPGESSPKAKKVRLNNGSDCSCSRVTFSLWVALKLRSAALLSSFVLTRSE